MVKLKQTYIYFFFWSVLFYLRFSADIDVRKVNCRYQELGLHCRQLNTVVY
jgi:hypothetical protein